MNTRNSFCISAMLGASLLVFSQLAWSLGLGEAKIESFLGEPLEVNIELITRPSDDLDSLSASLASAEDYELIGASRNDVSVPLQFSVNELDGDASITVSSELGINDPVLRLILEVKWSNGRMLREYTLFLDPPTLSRPAPAPRTETAGATASQPIAAPRPDAGSTTETQPATPSAQGADVLVPGADQYGPVQNGDTLWRIATDWSAGSGFNLNKVMLAIQRENPTAFSQNNINLLRRGAILRMPQKDSINTISSVVASSEVKKQTDAVQSRPDRNMADPMVPLLADESAAIEPVSDQQAGESALLESVTADEVPPSEPQADLIPSQLELLPPAEDKSLSNGSGAEETQAGADEVQTAQALREELSRKEEELINQQQQNSYLEQRLKELESQLAEAPAATVENENLAGMEERLRQERLADKETATPKVVPAPVQEKPWYSRFSLWLLALLVVIVVLVGWFMSRRGGADTVVSDLGRKPGPLSEFKDPAEDVLRVLDSTPIEQMPAEEAANEESIEGSVTAEADGAPEDAPGDAPGDAPEATQTMPVKNEPPADDEDAHLLDEESADPEIQLDLARAYISMGDKEAARVILEEVIANGSAEQQTEANKMKGLF